MLSRTERGPTHAEHTVHRRDIFSAHLLIGQKLCSGHGQCQGVCSGVLHTVNEINKSCSFSEACFKGRLYP